MAGKEGGNYQKDGKVELQCAKNMELVKYLHGKSKKGSVKFDSKEPTEAKIGSFSKTSEYILSILRKIGSQVKDFKIIVRHSRRGFHSFTGVQDGLVNQSWPKQASPGARALELTSLASPGERALGLPTAEDRDWLGLDPIR